MAHFAKLNENNEVIAVLVVNNESLDPSNEEQSGIDFLNSLFNDGSQWIQTSYNGNIRYNFAGIGYIYDPIDDAFIGAMPECGHDELTLNERKQWECSHASHVIILDEQ
jgi:hypothetical protein